MESADLYAIGYNHSSHFLFYRHNLGKGKDELKMEIGPIKLSVLRSANKYG
jgi:hypothetical protein